MITRRAVLQQIATLAVSSALAAPKSRRERLRIGAQTNTWGVPLKDFNQLLSILETLAKIGYHGFETNYRSLDDRSGQAAECRRAFKAAGIEYVGPHFGAALFEQEKIPSELENLKRVANYSADMGALHFILSGRRLHQQDGKLDLDSAKRKAAAINEAGRHCKEKGVVLCYHNHRQEFETDPTEMSVLLKETDPSLVWLNFDVGNPFVAGFDPAGFSAANTRRIRVYHLKDIKLNDGGRRNQTDFGAGDIDLKSVIAPVLESEWQGWLVVERDPNPAASPEETIRQCREYLRKITGV